jgi:hypothetical protein
MNRYNNPDFFRAWDLAQQIKNTRYVRSRGELERIEAEDAFYDEYGFYPDATYPEAIAAFKEYEDTYETTD